MREQNLQEMLTSVVIAGFISIMLTDGAWQTFAGLWVVSTMVVWNVIDKVKAVFDLGEPTRL